MAEQRSLVRAVAKALAWPFALVVMLAGLCGVIAYRYYNPDPVRIPTSDLDVDPPGPIPRLRATATSEAGLDGQDGGS